MTVVLCRMGETILVEVEILAVTLIDFQLEGQEDVFDHGVDLVSPREMGMKGAIHLAPILGRCEFLHVLPHAGGREYRVENSPNLFRVSEKGWDKGSFNFEFIPPEIPVTVIRYDRAASDCLVVMRGVLGLPHNGVIVSKSGVIVDEGNSQHALNGGQDGLHIFKSLSS